MLQSHASGEQNCELGFYAPDELSQRFIDAVTDACTQDQAICNYRCVDGVATSDNAVKPTQKTCPYPPADIAVCAWPDETTLLVLWSIAQQCGPLTTAAVSNMRAKLSLCEFTPSDVQDEAEHFIGHCLRPRSTYNSLVLAILPCIHVHRRFGQDTVHLTRTRC
jgi:hypothetical protein